MNDAKYVSSKIAQAQLGVCNKTLKKWAINGRIDFITTNGGWRRYNLDKYLHVNNMIPKKKICYCRVSSHDQKQKGDLDRQKARLLEYCVEKKYDIEYVFAEVGSGMNDKRNKLIKLMKLASDKKISKVVIEHKDRLIRFNYNILEMYFNSHGVVVEYVEQTLNKSFENELVEDMLTLMASFSAKIYGKRSHQNRKNKNET